MAIVKRHGSAIHAHKTYEFLALAVGLLTIYAISCLIWGLLRPARKFQYPTIRWWILAPIWIVLCLFGLLIHYNPDAIQLARRCGRLAFGGSIFGMLLSSKPAWLPRTYVIPLTRMHKWVGRTAVLFALEHGITYYYEYATHKVQSHLWSLFNVFGMISLLCYVIIAITSLKPFRERWYYIFYGAHLPLVWISTILLIWHSRPQANVMVIMAMVVLFVNVIWRIITTATTTDYEVETISPTLEVVTLTRNILGPTFSVGAHVRLSHRLNRPLTWLESTHPYTVASTPDDDTIKLVIRKTRFRIPRPLAVRGPFNAPFDPYSYKKVVLIAGGSGIALAGALRNHPCHKFIWATRLEEDIQVLDNIGVKKCDVYITRKSSLADEEYDNDANAQGIELENLAAEYKIHDNDESYGNSESVRRYEGRPRLTNAVGTFLDSDDQKTSCLVACGPPQLTWDAEKWAKENNYYFFGEAFGI